LKSPPCNAQGGLFFVPTSSGAVEQKALTYYIKFLKRT